MANVRGMRTVRDTNTRRKIQAAHIIRRLIGHLNGEIELSATQIKAAQILLNKVLPDLQAIDMHVGGEVVNTISAEPLTPEQWEREYGARH